MTIHHHGYNLRDACSRMAAAAPSGRQPLTAFRLPPELLANLDAEAERRGIARSAAVREALAQWLDTEDVAS